MQLGDVFIRPGVDDSKHRVLGFDDAQVHFDTWEQAIKSKPEWGSRIASRFINGRISRRTFELECETVGFEALTEGELRANPPDLPLRIYTDAWNWGQGLELNFEEFRRRLLRAQPEVNQKFAIAQIGVVPLRKTGAELKGPQVVSAKRGYLSVSELLWHALKFQKPVTTSGCGLHRDGKKGQIPTYYCWGAMDRAEYYNDY